MTPPSGPVVALFGTFLVVIFLTPAAWWTRSPKGTKKSRWKGLAAHPRALSLAMLLASFAPLFGFTAIALGLVGYAHGMRNEM